MRVYGKNACLAIFQNRPLDIIHVFLTTTTLKEFSSLIAFCTQNKKAYHLVSQDELEKMTKSTHHENICLLAKKPRPLQLKDLLSKKPLNNLKKAKEDSENIFLIALDQVSNPHNIGAILRSAAHFGAQGVILNDRSMAESGALIRTSEGGSEYVPVIEEKDLKQAVTKLKSQGFQIITTSSHAQKAKKSLYEMKWKNKVLLILGAENVGISKDLLSLGEVVFIPGTGLIESLNVSVALAVIMSDYFQKTRE